MVVCIYYRKLCVSIFSQSLRIPEMKQFLDEDFLLNNKTAVRLYHDYCAPMPIIDYHCHLDPQAVADDRMYETITAMWLESDHYKWRVMRANGVPEKYITGPASDEEKFVTWADTLQYCIGSPLLHWAQMELKNYFGITDFLRPQNASAIYAACNEKIKEQSYSVKNLIMRSNVEVLCTTDDPADLLGHHKKIKDDPAFTPKVLPSFRPDKGFYIESPAFSAWLNRLQSAADTEITGFNSFLEALYGRLNHFHSAGCRISDHAFEQLNFVPSTKKAASVIFDSALRGETVSPVDAEVYRSFMLRFLAGYYYDHGWVMQLHFGAKRNTSTRLYNLLGADAGGDSISSLDNIPALSALLDHLDSVDCLPRTIVYTLNPNDTEICLSTVYSFQRDIPGKLQIGSAWWFNDNRQGMEHQMNALANNGVLGRFIGMLTDSRSFLSYSRHEYFRRILCNLIGGWAEKGEVPGDMDWLGETVQNIAYTNAKNYFHITT